MKHEKSLFWLAILVLLVGDFFYFGSYFKSFMIEFVFLLSPEYTPVGLNEAGKHAILFATAVIGSSMYLIGLLILALTKDDKETRRKYLLYGVGLWVFFDSLSNIIFGFSYNLILNAVLLLVALLFVKMIDE